MKVNVYSVFDSKVEAYLLPFFMRADGEAVRAVLAASSDRQHQFYSHAADYTLFKIGVFEDIRGVLTPLTSFVNLGNVLQLRSVSTEGEANV